MGEPKDTQKIDERDLKTDVDYRGLSKKDFETFIIDMWDLWFDENGGGQPMDIDERFDVYCRTRVAEWRKERGL